MNNKEENSRDIQWNQMYELAKAYYEYHGNLFVPINFQVAGYKDNKLVKLGHWLSTQRTNYKEGKISKERIEKLENIGMVWKRKPVKENFRRYNEYDDWNKMYELAKKYYTSHGNLNDSETILIDGYRLDYWLSNQRHDYKKGNISNAKKELLDNIGMIWTDNYQKRKSNNDAWNQMYELAKAYYEYHGHLNIKRNFQVEGYVEDKIIKLGSWINNQRIQYRTGHLSNEKIEKLESIGIIWEKNKGKGRK
ncbi:MAG: helicase associated domain-containing protein [Bacilli bacterium]|nr:helicase associated domain-containing protein [Bacilli bacterium]